jgi:hypothetical protein
MLQAVGNEVRKAVAEVYPDLEVRIMFVAECNAQMYSLLCRTLMRLRPPS